MKSRQFYATHPNRCAAAGVELADLIQESFFALLDAVDAYDPASGFSFRPTRIPRSKIALRPRQGCEHRRNDGNRFPQP
jgi:hypothetical protein